MVRHHFFRRIAAVAMGLALFAAGTAPANAATTLAGGGSSFAGIEMDQWTDDVQSIVPPVEISYTPSSSGNGRTYFRAGTYPFAVSDIPYQGEAAGDNAPSWPFEYIPIVAGGLSFMYNVPGITTLKLNAAVACGIFTGEITSWNAPAIVALNPGVTLPNQEIIPVLRGDNAGTTWVLEDWCITEAPTVWASFVSYVNTNDENVTPPVTTTTPSSQFPAVGSAQTAQGDSGTAAVVGSSTGTYAITYVEPEYAREYGNKPVASVENASGDFVQPTPEDVAGALSYASGQSDGIQVLNFNGTGCNVYNPSTYSYMLARTDGSYGTGYGQTLGAFLNYVLTIGEKEASSIDYASIGLALEQYGIQQAQSIPGYPALTAVEQANFAAGDVTPPIVQSTACGAAFQLSAPATTTTVATTTTTVASTTTTAATTAVAATTTTAAPSTATTAHATTATTTHTTATTAHTTATTARTTATTARTTATTARTTATTARTTATTARTTATTARTTSPPTTERTSGGRTAAPSTPTTAARKTPGLVTSTTAPRSASVGVTTPTLLASGGAPAGTPTTQPATLGSHSSSPTTGNVAGTVPAESATTLAGASATSRAGSATTAPGSTATSAPGASVGGASATTAPGASGTAVSPTVSLTNTGPDAQTGGQQVFLVIAGLSIAGVSEGARRRLRKAR
jgi:ABC-type phosphate transport system substrate-binding protein